MLQGVYFKTHGQSISQKFLELIKIQCSLDFIPIDDRMFLSLREEPGQWHCLHCIRVVRRKDARYWSDSTRSEEEKDVKDLVGNRKNWDYLEDVHIDGKILLKQD
jgi:hypothetical protein